MTLYWPSVIIQNETDKRAWLSAASTGEVSLKKAMDTIQRARNNYTVLSAWIDTYDENDNTKRTIFHECYVNALGHVEHP